MYRFAGFFAEPPVKLTSALPMGYVQRAISDPFQGLGIRIAELIGETPDATEVHRRLHEIGLQNAERWIYLTYDCWGGRIDFVFGLGSMSGQVFGPLRDDNIDTVPSTYETLMGLFGVNREDALNFQPFYRGFWGE